MIRAAIMGANGYTGFELMKLLYNHPDFTLTAAASRSCAGKRLRDIYPSLGFAYGNATFVEPDADAVAKNADVVFTALPHAASAEIGIVQSCSSSSSSFSIAVPPQLEYQSVLYQVILYTVRQRKTIPNAKLAPVW